MIDKKNKTRKSQVDRTFFGLVIVLTLLGILSVADASAPQALAVFNDSFYFARQQLIWAGLGLASLVVVSNIHYTFWKKVALPLFVASIILLVMVLLPGFGSRLLGARRWLVIGPINFQPSEIIKLSIALYLAKVADSEKPTLAYLVPIALVAVLIMAQPDLGTTLVIVGIGLIQVFISGVSYLHLFGALLAGGVLSTVVVLFSSYRRQRLMTFLKSSADPLGSSYHIRQILIALGSGGIFGVGLGQSRQKYLFLPEVATDSVFAVIAEEIGFIGATILIILLTVLVIKIVKIALDAPDRFAAVLTAGIAAWIGGQIFLNLGSMVALIPLTGIPLPFFSYGGSSLLAILFTMGIVINISKYTNKKVVTRKARR